MVVDSGVIPRIPPIAPIIGPGGGGVVVIPRMPNIVSVTMSLELRIIITTYINVFIIGFISY